MSEYTVVVGLGNPQNVERLMRVGCMMAGRHDGRVEAVTVISVDCEEPVPAPEGHDRISRGYAILDHAQRIAEHACTRFTSHLSIGRPIFETLDEVAEATDAELILVGYSERRHPRGDTRPFDRLVDEIAARAPCDLLVARFVGEPAYGRVLVPVRARLDLDIRRDLLLALQDNFGSEIDVVHFAGNEQEAERMRDELAEWLEARGVKDLMNSRVEIHDNPPEAIVGASRDYDLVVIGTAPLHEVRRKFFGAIPEHVANHAACSTFLIRTRNVKFRPRG